jgi:anti-anti-sigma factor
MAELEGAPLHIKLQQEPAGPVISLAGELDGSNVDKLQSSLDPVLEDRPECLTFDLSGLTFMDTSGIAFLVRTMRSAGTIRIVNPSVVVRRVVDLTGLSKTLGMQP